MVSSNASYCLYTVKGFIGNDAISESKKIQEKWINFGAIENLKKTPTHMFKKIQEFAKNST